MAAILETAVATAACNDELTRLSTHPMFSALRATLIKDVQKSQTVPMSLMGKPVKEELGPSLDPAIVAVQEANLQSDFQQVLPLGNTKVTELQNFYNNQIADIESERCQAILKLKQMNMLGLSHFQHELARIHLDHDQQRMHLTNRVTASLQLLKITVPAVGPDAGKGKSKSRQLSSHAITVMMDWYERHIDNPYPTDDEKMQLAEQGCLSLSQVKAWFANKRNRTSNTKPKKQKLQVENKLLNICCELSGNAPKGTPRVYGEIIRQLSDIVNSSTVFNPNFQRDVYSSSGDERESSD